MNTKTKIKVSERALFARVNRKLAQEGETLRRSRADSRWLNETGALYVVDLRRNTIVAMHIDLAAYAAELGVLKPYEQLAD